MLGHVAHECLVGVTEVAQQHALRSLDAVVVDVLAERHRPLMHVASHRFRADVLVAQPGVMGGPSVEAVVQPVAQRLGPFDFFEALHALVVFDTLGLHLGQQVGAQEVPLTLQHHGGVLQGGFQHAQHVERVGGLVGVEEFDGIERERRQRLGQVELELQLDVDPHEPIELIGLVESFHHLRLGQRAVDRDGATDVGAVGRTGLVIVREQSAQGGTAIAGSVEHVHQHRMRHVELGAKRFRLAGSESLEGVGVPGRVAALGR